MEANLFESLARDRLVRQQVAKQSHLMFFHIYLPHYVKYPTAEFQKDIFRLTEDRSNNLTCIVAFRGSGKSTLITLSYSLWSILGEQQKKFVLIICRTQAQARQQMLNLKFELENNRLLKSDLGPFREETGGGDWAISSLVFQNTGARIMIASAEQSIRGIRHHEHRPDLLILDDVEDLNSTKTIEGRNKVFDWFTREVIPLGDIGTRVVLVGNLLHEDSLMMRLKQKMDTGDIKGVYRWFPLLDEEGRCLWPEKFDAPEKIDTLRRGVANEFAWQQEYLLRIVSDSSRVIFPEWIQYYAELPKGAKERVVGVYVGVDLAISQKETADYTAIVTLILYSHKGELKLFVLPNVVNRRMTYPETIQTIKAVVKNLNYEVAPTVVVESNGFQQIYADQLDIEGIEVESVKNTTDKRTRLALTSQYVQSGMIQFPARGAEALITQLTGFGVEHHDDLADAFAMAVMGSIETSENQRSFNAWLDFVDSNGGSAWIG
ncbi:hypothetical protein IT398_02235 [Candidatus Nomurabacteria bacterium]|nr:hypothetical protein [Candidatus Nomurabacteria bacterium]